MVSGQFALPWGDDVVVKDGTSCGIPAPTREFQGNEPNLLDTSAQKSLFKEAA